MSSDGPEDWTEELIGSPETGRRWIGLLEEVAPLAWLAPPEELEQAAETLEKLVARGAGHPGLAGDAEWLRACAELARTCVAAVERAGLAWDWDTRAGLGPTGARGGAGRSSYVGAVGAAWEQLRVHRNRHYYAETFAGIRARLGELFPPDELTDKKIKARIQSYFRWDTGGE